MKKGLLFLVTVFFAMMAQAEFKAGVIEWLFAYQ